MLAVLAVVIVAVTAVAILALQLWRPRFSYGWLAAAAGSLIAWGLAVAASTQLLRPFNLLEWQPQALLPVSPTLIIDLPSWTFLLAVLTLNLATVLTDVHRSASGERPGAQWQNLSAGLLLSAASALAVLAGNLLTLLLLWSAVDLIVAGIWLANARTSRETEQAVVALTLRLASSGLVIWADLSSRTAGAPTSLAALAPQTATLLTAAAALRLGLLPPHRPIPVLAHQQPALSTLTWLAGAAPAWLALTRAAQSGQPGYSGLFLLLGAAAGLYAGVRWSALRRAGAPGRFEAGESLPYWTLGVSALALGSAAGGQSFAVLAWSSCGLAAGGLLALAAARPRWLTPVLLLGVLTVAALPFTPAWPGVALYRALLTPAGLLLLPIYLITHGLLLTGYLRRALQRAPLPPTAERWVWLIYPLGLLLLPAAQALALWKMRTTPSGMAAWPGWIESGLAFMGIGLAVVIAALPEAKPGPLPKRLQAALPFATLRTSRWLKAGLPRRLPAVRLNGLFELNGVYQAGWRAYTLIGRLGQVLNRALEGRGGLLWALLLLALLISLLAQMGPGS